MDEKTILVKMQNDMHITRYEGESYPNFVGRTIYSALCEWMRYCILDELTSTFEQKSKIYILNRMREQLYSYMASFPIVNSWICEDDTVNVDDLIKNLRDKMISSGELLEVDKNKNLGLPVYRREKSFAGYCRVLGIDEFTVNKIHIGITRIVKSEIPLDPVEGEFSFDITEYLMWLYEHAQWNQCSNSIDYEYFNPYSTRAPYQSWTNNIPKYDKMVLGRLSLYNGVHEYYLIKKEKEKLFSASLTDALADWKEERRILLGLRKIVGNQMLANYSKRGNVYVLKLYCGLPIREQAFIDTYCWPLNSMDDKYNYVVPEIVWPDICTMMEQSLAIRLKEK